MSDAIHIDVDASVDIDKRELFLERNFRIIKDILIIGGFRMVGTTNQPVFENGWINYNSSTDMDLQFLKLNNTIFMEGRIKDGSTGDSLFTLPIGFRPAMTHIYPAVGAKGANIQFASITIQPDGKVIVDAPPPPIDWVAIPLISFILS